MAFLAVHWLGLYPVETLRSIGSNQPLISIDFLYRFLSIDYAWFKKVWLSQWELILTSKAPSTLIRFQTKTELFCSGYGYRPHYNAANDHRKRSHSKTLSKVERFENDVFWKRCFLVWTEKTMISENDDVIKIDTTGFRPLDRGYPKWRTDATMWLQFCANFASRYIEMCMHRVHLSMPTEGIKAFLKQIRRCSVDGRKRYENDKCGRKSFCKRSKTAPFSFENGIVWTVPK